MVSASRLSIVSSVGCMDDLVDLADGFGESAESLLVFGLALVDGDEPCDIEGCPGPPDGGGRCLGMQGSGRIGSACLNSSEWFRVLLFERMAVWSSEPDGIPMDAVVYACHQIGVAMQEAAEQVQKNGPLVDWIADMTVLRAAFCQDGEQGFMSRILSRWRGRRADKRSARRAVRFLGGR